MRNKSMPYELKRKAAMQMKNSIDWLYLFSFDKIIYSKKEKRKCKFKINFITLTLSSAQMHSDTYIVHRMLGAFMDWFSRNYSNMYVWKAEIQQNGNIHFHITTNAFIHWKTIRAKWNSIQAKHGYHKQYDNRESLGSNSIDVHAVKNDEGLSKYMCKYMMKNDSEEKVKKDFTQFENHFYKSELSAPFKNEKGIELIRKRNIHCRIWAASQNLSNLSIQVTAKNEKNFWQMRTECIGASEKIINNDFATVMLHDKSNHMKFSRFVYLKTVELYHEGNFRQQGQKHFTIWSLKDQDPISR